MVEMEECMSKKCLAVRSPATTVSGVLQPFCGSFMRSRRTLFVIIYTFAKTVDLDKLLIVNILSTLNMLIPPKLLMIHQDLRKNQAVQLTMSLFGDNAFILALAACASFWDSTALFWASTALAVEALS